MSFYTSLVTSNSSYVELFLVYPAESSRNPKSTPIYLPAIFHLSSLLLNKDFSIATVSLLITCNREIIEKLVAAPQ